MAGAGDGRRLAESAGTVAALCGRREGRRRTVDAGRAEDLKKRNGLLSPVRKKREDKRKRERKMERKIEKK